MEYSPSDFVKLAWKYIPRCISHYHTEIVKEKNLEEYKAKFFLSCTCKLNVFSVKGDLNDEIGVVPPILTVCNACHKEVVLLDLAIHGHDAELGYGSNYPVKQAEYEKYSCPECDSKDFKINVSLTYQFESIDEFDDIKQDSISNLFDVVGIELACVNCKDKSYLGDYECA